MRDGIVSTIFFLVLSFGNPGNGYSQKSSVSAPLASQNVASPGEFHVDGGCRIHDTIAGAQGIQPHSYRDRGICAVDTEHFSSRPETDIVNSQRKRVSVAIREHTFTFHNPTQEPTTFVLDQTVPRGWQVDSDPAPSKVSGTVATFLLSVDPGQTVSLHVGERNPPRN